MDYSPYTLPTIDFVGGSTQDLVFHVYSHIKKRPYSLTFCSCNFAVVSYTNRTGAPIISKAMTVSENEDMTTDNVLTVSLDAEETAPLHGKYIYQITIKDVDGEAEIPNQGILYINNNINKGFIVQ